MALDLTINAVKGIKITTGAGGIFYIRNGNLKNFFADKVNNAYYFNYETGTQTKYDYFLKWSDIGTFNSGVVPDYSTLAQLILAELDAEK